MEKFVEGDIVVIPFPFTDLSQFKRRPALILKDLGNDDFLLAMITSKAYNSPYSLKIAETDFTGGSLPAEGYVRCNWLFEVNSSIILKKAATVSKRFTGQVIDILISFLKSEI